MGRQYQNGSYGKVVGSCGPDARGSGQGPVTGYCEHDNEPSGSIKGGELLTSWVTIRFSRSLPNGVSLYTRTDGLTHSHTHTHTRARQPFNCSRVSMISFLTVIYKNQMRKRLRITATVITMASLSPSTYFTLYFVRKRASYVPDIPYECSTRNPDPPPHAHTRCYPVLQLIKTLQEK